MCLVFFIVILTETPSFEMDNLSVMHGENLQEKNVRILPQSRRKLYIIMRRMNFKQKLKCHKNLVIKLVTGCF